MIKIFFSRVIAFFKQWDELITFPIAIVIWALSSVVIHLIDAYAATYDIAVFQKIAFALTAFLVFSFFGWILMWIQFPNVFKFLSKDFETNFSQLNPYQQCVISFCVLAYFLLGLALCGLIL